MSNLHWEDDDYNLLILVPSPRYWYIFFHNSSFHIIFDKWLYSEFLEVFPRQEQNIECNDSRTKIKTTNTTSKTLTNY